ncbi:DegT/DnrJ/EryC1/StrS family aminotransferase, partial [Nostoc sp. NIES-2111]
GGRMAALEGDRAHRLAMSRLYRTSIASAEHAPEEPGEVPWRHTILVDATERNSLVDALRKRGYHASTWYPPVNALFGAADDCFPGAERFASRVINLWVDPATPAEVAAKTAAFVETYLSARAA